MNQPWRVTSEGLLLAVRATPGARREDVCGVWYDADGSPWLDIKVRAAPEDGKANDAIISMLCIQLSAKRRDVVLVKGAKSRLKTFKIEGVAVDTLSALLEKLGQRE